MSPFWVLLELRVMEVVATAAAAVRHANKAPVKLSPTMYGIQTHNLSTGQMPSLPVA